MRTFASAALLLCMTVHADDGFRALHKAAIRGDAAAITTLLAAGADPNARDPWMYHATALHQATEGCHAGAMRALLDGGADPNLPARERGGRTIHQAVFHCDLATVRVLLDGGADPNWDIPGGWGRTPLLYEVIEGLRARALTEPEIVPALLAAGADPNVREEHGSETPLLAAAQYDQTVSVRALLEAGADPGAKDRKGRAAFEVKDEDGSRALHWAAELGDERVIAALVAGGAEVNARDGWGRAPLLRAALRKDHEGRGAAVAALLDAGADPNLWGRGKHELSPLHAAAFHGDAAAVTALLAAGADPHAKDRTGRTPLRWARSKRRTEVIRILGDAMDE